MISYYAAVKKNDWPPACIVLQGIHSPTGYMCSAEVQNSVKSILLIRKGENHIDIGIAHIIKETMKEWTQN